jgi:hypothetical protein
MSLMTRIGVMIRKGNPNANGRQLSIKVRNG